MNQKQEIPISLEQAQHMVVNHKGGSFFGVEFVKRTNSEVRVMNCRKGVTKHLKGGALSFNPIDHDLVGVWDRNGGYRCINLPGLIRVNIGGKRYIVRG